MSFSQSVRRELAKSALDRKCCAAAELSGAILASGGLSFRGPGRYGLAINVDSVQSATRYKSVMRKFFGVECLIAKLDSPRLGGLTRYAVSVPDESATGLADELSLLDKNAPFGIATNPPKKVIASEHCKKAFLRGAYIVAGQAGDPRKGYHLEIDVADEQIANCIEEVFKYFGVNARVSERKKRSVVYVKDGDQMAAALAVMGAFNSLMEFENTRIIRDCRNEANRLTNCDSANVDKAIAAAQRQISMIQAISRHGGLDGLPEPLRELARARLSQPYASLTELGASLNPPIGKSGVNARMRKLQAIAEELVND